MKKMKVFSFKKKICYTHKDKDYIQSWKGVEGKRTLQFIPNKSIALFILRDNSFPARDKAISLDTKTEKKKTYLLSTLSIIQRSG